MRWGWKGTVLLVGIGGVFRATESAVANSQAAVVAFEVASIRRTPPRTPGALHRVAGCIVRGSSVDCEGPLKSLLIEAYGVSADRLSGPGWLMSQDPVGSERFSILAKIPEQSSADQFRPMLRALLTERFQMTTHVEKRELPVFSLRVAQSGSKLPPGNPETARPTTGFRGRLELGNASMADLVRILNAAGLERPVVDETQLEGRFQIKLAWRRDTEASASTEPELFTALREQLGLMLRPERLPVDVVVIDRLAKEPTAN
jgi:uncharacterized protein (TIGR03435 family)